VLGKKFLIRMTEKERQLGGKRSKLFKAIEKKEGLGLNGKSLKPKRHYKGVSAHVTSGTAAGPKQSYQPGAALTYGGNLWGKVKGSGTSQSGGRSRPGKKLKTIECT